MVPSLSVIQAPGARLLTRLPQRQPHCVRQYLAIAEATAERGGEEGGVELAGRSLLRDSEELDKNKYVYLHDGISFLKVPTMLETGPDGAKS